MKDIPGYEGKYAVTEDGKVWSYHSQAFYKTRYTDRGYEWLKLYNKGRYKTKRVHRLVAETYLSNPFNKPCVNHIDGVKSNNHVDNLEWVTDKENDTHARMTGLTPPPKLTVDDVLKMRVLYSQGISTTKLAKLFNVAEGTSHAVITRRTWKHVT